MRYVVPLPDYRIPRTPSSLARLAPAAHSEVVDSVATVGLLSVTVAALGILATALFRLEAKMDAGLARLASRLDAGFGRVDSRLDRIDDRFDRVDARFDRVDDRFRQMDARFDHVDERLSVLELRLEHHLDTH
jgi:hypothetical protein